MGLTDLILIAQRWAQEHTKFSKRERKLALIFALNVWSFSSNRDEKTSNSSKSKLYQRIH